MTRFIKHNTITILKSQWKTIALVVMLLSFLLMLINIFAWLVYGINHLSDNVRSKLGVYLYIKEDPTQVDQIFSQVKSLSQELKQSGMKMTYYSKSDALDRLQKKIPDVVKNFNKYGIKNPLPPTLYVVFQKEEDLILLNTIVSKYQNIISNTTELEKTTTSFRDQEKRVQSFISMSQLGTISLIIGTVILLCIISTFLTFMVKSLFDSQVQYIQVTTLLGASIGQLKIPFYLSQIIILVCASIVMIIVSYVMMYYTDGWIQDIYQVSLLDIVHRHRWAILGLIFIELMILISFNTLFSRFYLDYLLRAERS